MASEQWQKNLYAIFIAEFIVLVGFQFVTPFIPLYIQELGDFTIREAAFWAGIASGLAGMAMFLSAPLWGLVADRWGRKPMLLRAQLGSAVVIALTGMAPNIYYLVVLRFMNGLLSGTVAAASALVASGTPREKMPFAMGLVMVATFGGNAFGPLLGGLLADNIGYRNAFFVTSFLLLVGGLIVLFYVKEDFERSDKGERASLRGMWRLVSSRDMFSLLLAVFVLPLGPQIVSPNIPLFFKELNPEGRAATASGVTYFMMGVLASISSVITGRMSGRFSLKKLLVISCLCTGILYLPPMWAQTVAQLAIFIAITGLFKGGIMTSVNSLVGLSASVSQQGVVYGVASSAQSLGNGIGPLIGGPLASLLGFRHVFGVSAALYGLAGLYIYRTFRGQALNKT